jgi:flagella basal body P-ring formation protein FlgA
MSIRFLLTVAFCVVAFSAFAQTGEAARDQAEIMVPAHDIARGAVIADGDFEAKSIPAARVNESLVRAAADAVGKETRRNLRAGEIVRLSDLKRPTLVAKGSTVTLVFEVPGMRLTSIGRALAEGGDGDTIAVLNPTSYRQVQAVVTGPGTAHVGATAPNASAKVASAQK